MCIRSSSDATTVPGTCRARPGTPRRRQEPWRLRCPPAFHTRPSRGFRPRAPSYATTLPYPGRRVQTALSHAPPGAPPTGKLGALMAGSWSCYEHPVHTADQSRFLRCLESSPRDLLRSIDWHETAGTTDGLLHGGGRVVEVSSAFPPGFAVRVPLAWSESMATSTPTDPDARTPLPVPRARIGLIIPSVNTCSEPQFHHFAPAGLGIHVARARIVGPWQSRCRSWRRRSSRRPNTWRTAARISWCSTVPRPPWRRARRGKNACSP